MSVDGLGEDDGQTEAQCVSTVEQDSEKNLIESIDLVRDEHNPSRVHLIKYIEEGTEIVKSGTYVFTGTDPHWPYEIKWDEKK